MHGAYMELTFDRGFGDMGAGYPIDYYTSEQTGFDDMGADMEADRTRVLELVWSLF